METQEQNTGWIGVDFDRTLVTYDEWRGCEHIGEPIAPMVERVKAFLAEGRIVRIFTARIAHDSTEATIWDAARARVAIEKWCERTFGRTLEVTNVKDQHMDVLYDDRVVQVVPNEGTLVGAAA